MIKKTFKIPDMSCSNCAMKLEALEDTLDGVKEIKASYHKLQMTVEYDESSSPMSRSSRQRKKAIRQYPPKISKLKLSVLWKTFPFWRCLPSCLAY